MSIRMVFKQYRFDLPGKDGRVNPEECNYIICYMRFTIGLSTYWDFFGIELPDFRGT